MHTFMGAVHQGGNRQLQFPVHGNLLVNRHRVRFDQRKSERGHVFISDTVTIQSVESDPCSSLRLPVADGVRQILRVPLQGFQQLSRSAVKHTLGGHPFAVFVLPCISGHVSHMIVRIK